MEGVSVGLSIDPSVTNDDSESVYKSVCEELSLNSQVIMQNTQKLMISSMKKLYLVAKLK